MTLSDAAEKTKAISKWALIGFGVLSAIFLILTLFSFLRNTFFPAPLPPPEVKFGKLPSPDFPSLVKSQNSFFVDTISGSLPVFPTQIKVYKMHEAQPDILALSKTKSILENIGLEASPLKISENIYQWKSNGKTLTFNIRDLNFNMISNFLESSSHPAFSKEKETTKEIAQNFLQNLGILPPDLDFEKTTADLYIVENYSIVPATSLSAAQAVQVSFFQKNFNELPVFYTRYNVSTMNFLVGDLDGDTQVVEANFFYQKPSELSSTYPIKSTGQAFEDLKKGNAYFVKNSKSEKIGIKNVTLGYYISERKQEFLLPIIVFEDGDGFVAYVSAISDEWMNK